MVLRADLLAARVDPVARAALADSVDLLVVRVALAARVDDRVLVGPADSVDLPAVLVGLADSVDLLAARVALVDLVVVRVPVDSVVRRVARMRRRAEPVRVLRLISVADLLLVRRAVPRELRVLRLEMGAIRMRRMQLPKRLSTWRILSWRWGVRRTRSICFTHMRSSMTMVRLRRSEKCNGSTPCADRRWVFVGG